MVLDDLGDRLHIAYLGEDAALAASLGYWQVDRGVFELLTPRDEVTGLIEERVEKPLLGGLPTTSLSYPYDSAPVAAASPAAPVPGPIPDGGGRAARRQRVATRDIFCELADLAAIPRTAYALETEMDGALCLMPGPDGYEVFMSMDGARHEARSFPEEEAAYFYLFGVLAAEAVRNGVLLPAFAGAGARQELS
jgi:hypothetical protein